MPADSHAAMAAEIVRLREANAALLAACRGWAYHFDIDMVSLRDPRRILFANLIEATRAAVAKAEGDPDA